MFYVDEILIIINSTIRPSGQRWNLHKFWRDYFAITDLFITFASLFIIYEKDCYYFLKRIAIFLLELLQ